MSSWLLDTGPMVAYLNARDQMHRAVSTALDDFRGQLCTTSAVITETMHFVSSNPSGSGLLVEFILSADIQIFDFSQPASLRKTATLMKTYRDTPMDYADATLVLLAEHLKCFEILTLDRRGFSTYRASQNRTFKLVLDYLA